MQTFNETVYQQSPDNVILTAIEERTSQNYDSISTYSAANSSVADSEYIATEIKRYERERQLDHPAESQANQINLQISVLSGKSTTDSFFS